MLQILEFKLNLAARRGKSLLHNVNSTGAKNRSARSAREKIFRRLGRASRGLNGEIKPTSNF
jgi:hypothetical protein